VRTAPDQRTGLRVAAGAIRRGLVNAANVAGSTTARDYIKAVPDITDTNVDALLVRADVDGHAVISRMPAHDRARLADALDSAAISGPRT
jgi:hypothetical protein